MKESGAPHHGTKLRKELCCTCSGSHRVLNALKISSFLPMRLGRTDILQTEGLGDLPSAQGTLRAGRATPCGVSWGQGAEQCWAVPLQRWKQQEEPQAHKTERELPLVCIVCVTHILARHRCHCLLSAWGSPVSLFPLMLMPFLHSQLCGVHWCESALPLPLCPSQHPLPAWKTGNVAGGQEAFANAPFNAHFCKSNGGVEGKKQELQELLLSFPVVS